MLNSTWERETAHHGACDNDFKRKDAQPCGEVSTALAPAEVPRSEYRGHHEVHDPLPLPPLQPAMQRPIRHVKAFQIWDH